MFENPFTDVLNRAKTSIRTLSLTPCSSSDAMTVHRKFLQGVWRYLKDWRDAAAGQNRMPNINVAIMNGVAKRQRRLKTTSHPSGPKQAQDEVTTRFGPIVGGMNDPKTTWAMRF